MEAEPIYRTKHHSISSFMRLVYSGGAKSRPTTQPIPVKEDQCGQLVNLVMEMTEENKPTTESDFLELIYKAFEVTAEQMQTHISRKRELVDARQLHMYLRKHYFGMSYANAASIYGKDHATALHASTTIHNAMDTNKHYRAKTSNIWQLWKANGVPFPKELNTTHL